jgi:glucose/arabinose dehydrogenase
MLVLCAALAARAGASTLPTGFVETQVGGGLTGATAMAIAPDGRILVAEQAGAVRVVAGGALLPTPFARLAADATGERGLLGIAVDPGFPATPYVYVYYSAADIGANRLSRLVAAGDVAAPGEPVLAELSPYGTAIWHMGGALVFGTDDKLYVGVGDHQNTSLPQSLASLPGKLLRFERDGTIPPDNPFFDTASGLARAIWAYGLRNPFMAAADPASGRLFIR